MKKSYSKPVVETVLMETSTDIMIFGMSWGVGTGEVGTGGALNPGED